VRRQRLPAHRQSYLHYSQNLLRCLKPLRRSATLARTYDRFSSATTCSLKVGMRRPGCSGRVPDRCVPRSNAFSFKAVATLKRKTNKKSNKNDRGTSASAGFLLVCGSEHTLSRRIRKVRLAQAVPTALLLSTRVGTSAPYSGPICRHVAFKGTAQSDENRFASLAGGVRSVPLSMSKAAPQPTSLARYVLVTPTAACGHAAYRFSNE
jgi:hypothetical protein